MSCVRRVSAVWAGIVVSAGLLGVLDAVSGHELSFFLFYFLPVGLAGWCFGAMPAVGVSMLCAGVWFGADFLGGHEYSNHVVAVWNTIIRLSSFLCMGWVVARIRQALREAHAASEELRRALAEVKLLQGILPICASCKKIRDEQGSWQQMESYIHNHSEAQFSHGLCPECAEKLLKDAGLDTTSSEQGSSTKPGDRPEAPA
ncbi:MAG: hypothetical protein JXQ73_03235 [Phycisphaerae bacterium]|nr:hypothetical protein [Phycisphaerae bacterium]